MQLSQDTAALVAAIAHQQRTIIGIMDSLKVPANDPGKDSVTTLRNYMDGMREQCELVQRETFEMQVKRHKLKDRNTELEQQCHEVRSQRKKMEAELEQVKAQIAHVTELCAQLGIPTAPSTSATTATMTTQEPSPHSITPQLFYSSQGQFFFAHSSSFEQYTSTSVMVPATTTMAAPTASASLSPSVAASAAAPLLLPLSAALLSNGGLPSTVDDLAATATTAATGVSHPSTPSGKPPRSPQRHERGLSSSSMSSTTSGESPSSDRARRHTAQQQQQQQQQYPLKSLTPEPELQSSSQSIRKSVSTSDLHSPRTPTSEDRSPTRRATHSAMLFERHSSAEQRAPQQQSPQQPQRLQPQPYSQQHLYQPNPQHRAMVSWPGFPLPFPYGHQSGVAIYSAHGPDALKQEDGMPMFVAVPTSIQPDGTAAATGLPFPLNLAMMANISLGHASCPGQMQFSTPLTSSRPPSASTHHQFANAPVPETMFSTPRAAATR